MRESVEIAKLQKHVQLAELELSLRRMELRRLQLQDELDRLEENYRATLKAIELLRKEVEGNA
ncbi:MAG: hypothetical protein QXI19_11365 [Candidatus Caldarchaeum sp.]